MYIYIYDVNMICEQHQAAQESPEVYAVPPAQGGSQRRAAGAASAYGWHDLAFCGHALALEAQ